MAAIIIHGGCYDIVPGKEIQKLSLKGIRTYGERGFKMLKEGACALDTAEAVLHLLEDDPLYDAGTGSFKTLNGEVEMDALIMDSESRCGGVIGIQHVQYPSHVARLVMEKTPHNLLSGPGAEQFAFSQGVPWFKVVPNDDGFGSESPGNIKRMLGDIHYYNEYRKQDSSFSTVGVAALDNRGYLVAATSTGGIRRKMPGRVGDSALPGAGTYCTKELALSATGEGEGITRICLTARIAMEYEQNKNLTEVLKKNIQRGSAIDCICGVIALTKEGEYSYAFNGAFMAVYHNKT
ncbi:MAG: isoaspartyl peptidase/L-asparaginase [Treponema sp.]|jgi:beta-aspartyl-peptidase (threonine type)|nr:isoaspartyl peptidase/L-asparaginase [Treponema sp.]